MRQLQRQLQSEGTSFQALVDKTCQEFALRHLQNPETPIYDIAFLLGFSEPSAFQRAFKRWTGETTERRDYSPASHSSGKTLKVLLKV